jgi:hypothetical protein
MKLKQDFSVLLFQLFRTAGFTLNITQTEALRETSDKIVNAIEALAKERTVELVRKMQEAVGAGFTAIGKDIDALEARLDKVDAATKVTVLECGPKEAEEA